MLISILDLTAIKNLRGEYYLNGHWAIDFSRAMPIAGTMLYYQRGTEGEKTSEVITGRGPTTEPLVIEVKAYSIKKIKEMLDLLLNEKLKSGFMYMFK